MPCDLRLRTIFFRYFACFLYNLLEKKLLKKFETKLQIRLSLPNNTVQISHTSGPLVLVTLVVPDPLCSPLVRVEYLVRVEGRGEKGMKNNHKIIVSSDFLVSFVCSLFVHHA